MTTAETIYDLVIVGSGGGGLTAALAAAEAGLHPVVIEKQQFVGGSTAMSGGVIWMPNNPLMREEGVSDSRKAGLDYFQSVVGDPDDGSSLARREAFLDLGSEMITFLRCQGVDLIRCEGYSDYYDNLKGGSSRGRSVEAAPWDGKQLGEWNARIHPGIARAFGLAVKTNEIRKISTFQRSAKSFAATTGVFLRTKLARRAGKDLLTNGMSLIGQMTKAALDAGIPIWLESSVEELVVEEGRVVGVVVNRKGTWETVRATRGVLLSAGGFERNPEMRRKYTENTQPNDGQWTSATGGNTGEVLAAAIALGAKTDYMDEAVWQPSPRKEFGMSALSQARQWAHTILVNKHGKRFCNESNSYVEVGRAMYANDAAPAWLIFDDNYRRNVVWSPGLPALKDWRTALPGKMPERWIAEGWMRRADTVEALARQIGLDPQVLTETVSEYNMDAERGRDPQFGRGESQYNKVLGDPGHKANPAVGPLNTGPYYATEIYPGDVGTAGGVVTNEHAQVLDESNAPIPGLYAAGNMTATVMGRNYLGAGASIANTMVFGYIAALHASESEDSAVQSRELAS
ncbi:FAD-dependent oxidoreductase [Rhodococcus koreensis]